MVVPGADGFFGVLPRHSPLLSTLLPGVIDVYEDGSVTDRIFVAGGFAEVTEDRCTVIPNGADPLPEMGSAVVPGRLLYIGSFAPWQGLPELLMAQRRILRARLPLHLRLSGPAKKRWRRQLLRACRRLRIDPAIVAGPFLICLSDISGSAIYIVVARKLIGLP